MLNVLGCLAYRHRMRVKLLRRRNFRLQRLLCAYSTLPPHTICTICVEPVTRADTPISLPCSPSQQHFFHFTCFARWHLISQTCPICRSQNYLRPASSRRRSPSPTASPLQITRTFSAVNVMETERLSFAQQRV